MTADNSEYLKMFGMIFKDASAMSRCACVACNSCTCACSCRYSQEQEDAFWE